MNTYWFTRKFAGSATIGIEAESEEAARAASDADPDQGDWELPRTLRDCTDIGELELGDVHYDMDDSWPEDEE